MNVKISMVEIPAKDFEKAIQFYKTIFDANINICCDENEKMAFFETAKDEPLVAISCHPDFEPSSKGVLASFDVGEDLTPVLEKIANNGGKIVIPKTKIDCEEMGYFANFIDSEGNRLGLYSEN
jgi:predicted enzyme related to lactoylglutathione lyase